MLETVLLLLLCAAMAALALAVAVWLVITGGILALDNLLLAFISLTVAVIFGGIFAWSVRSGEFRQVLGLLRKKSDKDASSQ